MGHSFVGIAEGFGVGGFVLLDVDGFGRWWLVAGLVGLVGGGVLGGAAHGRERGRRRPFELLTRRMDVDVDGAPRAYGPPGGGALDSLKHAHRLGKMDAPVVGYLVEDGPRHGPVVQGPGDPAPGFYVSQTAYEDESVANERDPRRYVDATKINYVVLGDEARRRGARLGDFVVVHSRRTGRTVFGIVGDDGNPTGDEGSLHLLQALGYDFHDGREDAVEKPEIVVRFYPGSNRRRLFFRSQEELDRAARRAVGDREWEAGKRK